MMPRDVAADDRGDGKDRQADGQAEDAEDEGEPDREERVDGPQEEPVQQLLHRLS